MDKIATVIVHYNTDVDTKETLLSLSKARIEGFEHQVFVVDNASKVPFKLPQQYKNVTLVRSDTNLGFTGGNNLGFKVASEAFDPDYFLLLNSDMLVKEDFLVKLHQKITQNADIGVVTPKMYFAPSCEYHRESYKKNEVGRVIWCAGGVIDRDNLASFHIGVDEVDRGQFEQKYDLWDKAIDFASGACFLVRREALAVAGVFDDKYFLYFEDADLSARIKRAGFTIELVTEAVVWHKNGGSTSGSGSDLQHYYLSRNRLVFFMKYGRWREKLRCCRVAWDWWRHGSRVEKLAVNDWVRGNLGKRSVI